MAAPEQTSDANGVPPNPGLDVAKLHSLPSEQQDLYLLTFTADLARHAVSLDADGASAHQVYFKKELLQIINLPSPAPTRVIRNNLGRTFAAVFGKGDRKLLFESINELVGIVNAGKSDKDVKAKHAAIHCLGAVFEAAGDSAISLAILACTCSARLLKVAQNHAGLRSSIFEALGRIVKGVGASLDEAAARDIWKQARSTAASDKSLLVQLQACWCLEQLVRGTSHFDNSNDFEKLQGVVWKAIDNVSPSVRHAAASCLATALVKSYSEVPAGDTVPRTRKPKKASKKQTSVDGDDDSIDRAESPAPQKLATELAFSLPDLLRQLSVHYCRTATSNRARAGIAVCYLKVLESLPAGVVENRYSDVARHCFNELLSFPTVAQNRYRQLTTRKYVRIILEDVVGQKILGEAGQTSAARFLLNDIIKDYPPALKERLEPGKQVLIGALSALTSLLTSLGAATTGIAESCREGLLQVLQHPSYAVQIHASSAFKSLVMACPQQLLPSVTICMNSVNRELALLAGPRRSPRRCIGYANGLAAILSTAHQQPLYGSVDVYSRVLSQATTLLKSSGSSDIRISSTQIQVAWILLSGLMTLGPNFVKIHLSQLLLLWKNALPKPLNRDHMVQRNMLELCFLTHVRECALGSMLAFLHFNSRLLTTDVAKRLAAMLQNTAMFLTSIPSKKNTEDATQRLTPALQLYDYDLMVRRRVLQCYTRLVIDSPSSSSETLLQSSLLPLTISSFADPEDYAPSSLSTAIAGSIGAFESIWDVGDNCGFGVTGRITGFDIKPTPGEQNPVVHHWVTQVGAMADTDLTLLSPVCGAHEHDSMSLYIGPIGNFRDPPNPLLTQVVDSAIDLFAIAFPLQPPKIQESILEQITSFLSSNSLQRDPARKAAMTVNIATALLGALKVAAKGTALPAGNVQAANVEKGIQDLLHGFIINPDQYVRNIASEALGRLCSSSGNYLTTTEVKHFVEQIVSNRDPIARSGCALALGCIHSQLGGMAAGYHLKSILGILMSLANDPHPTVHFWALEALSRVADSAGLTFSSYVSSTLGMLAQLYVVETHNAEVGSLASSNLEVDLPSPAVIARCIDSVINVLGPDLQDMTKARDMVMTLIGQFQQEEDVLVLIESLKCQEHLSLYVPGYLDFGAYVKRLQKDLFSESSQIRDIAVDGLHNLMRRNAEEVVQIAEPGLEEQLWLLLNQSPAHHAAQNIIRNWLEQTGLVDTAQWIQRTHAVLTRTVNKPEQAPSSVEKKTTGAQDFQDEEVAGFAAASGTAREDAAAGAGPTQELLKWQVRTFAMDCLSELLAIVSTDTTSRDESTAQAAVQQRVADVIRIAFSASTAGVVTLRIRGLHIIGQILRLFGKTPDPDFPEASLLEQYQAQMSSALTPAFAADSSPELAAEAVNVCATFVATGIVTDVDRMGRILKLVVSALENFSSETESATIGDLKGLGSNAQVMVKMAVLSAWAELQVASVDQQYLVDVLTPHIARLTPLWLASLREYARLRFEPDISTTAGSVSLSGSLDTIYAALNRETLLEFYQSSWLKLVDAIASLIDTDSEFVFDALDGKTESSNPGGTVSKSSDINYRDEPVAFFFVLFGLAFEALVSRPGDAQVSREQTMEILQALKKILSPAVSGHAIYQEVVFSEAMDMLDRLVLTEGFNVQTVIVEIARNLCLGHPSARQGQDTSIGEEKLSEDVDQLFELTRIIVLVLAGLVPNLTEHKFRARPDMTDETVSLLSLSLSALVDAAAVFPAVIKTDLHACIVHIFATILSTGTCQAIVVPQVLPIFRRFVTSLSHNAQPETSTQLRGALTRFLAILKNAQKRESEASLPCEKNTMLACTILLSSAGNTFDPSDPLLKTFIDELVNCLGNRVTSQVAGNCCRSLLLLPKKHPADSALAAHLLPRLLEFLAHPTDVEGLEGTRTLVAHMLTSLVSTLQREQLQTAMALVVPTLLTRASAEGTDTYKESGTRLLELAGTGQTAFKSIVGAMNAEQKRLLEEVLKAGASGKAGMAGRMQRQDDGGEPSIALKMDFGA